jgi:DNA-binding transcriptional LysR family regulator
MAFDLDIQLMRTFLATVETGSLTSAGKKVGRTQSAISHQIQRLEEGLGRALFAYDRRRLTLTRDGEILLEYARAVLKLNEEARGAFFGLRVGGHVTIGTPDLYSAYILPSILGSFSRSYPNIEIQLRCTRSVHLHAALEQGELDVALLTKQPEFTSGTFVRREALVWVCDAHQPPELTGSVRLAVLPAGSVYRKLALEALGAAGRHWSIRSVCDSIAGLQAAVFAGLAVSVFPECAVVPGLRRLGKSEGFPKLPAVELTLHRRKGGISPAAEHLAQYIVAELGGAPRFTIPAMQD